MDIEAPALGWAQENLGPAGEDMRPTAAGSGGTAIRTSYYETQVKEAESPGSLEHGLALQLTLVDNRHFFVMLGGTELSPEDVTVMAPGDYLTIELHVGPDTCSRHGALYRSGRLIFGESGAGFKGLTAGTCDGDNRTLQIVGAAARQPERNLDDLLTMQDGTDASLPGQSRVRGKVRERFGERLKASPAVQPVFFPTVRSTVRVPDDAWVDSIAAALICAAVGEISIRNFRQLVDARAASRYLDDQFDSPAAKACAQTLYDEAYDEFAMSSKGVRFSEYLQQRAQWGPALTSWVTGRAFLTTIGARFAAGDAIDANKTLNRTLHLLKRLGASIQDIDAVRTAFAAFPLWAEVSLGMDLDRLDFPNSTFTGDVITVASQQEVVGIGGQAQVFTTYFGERLVGFLNSPHAARFRTSVSAANWETQSAYACLITGTPVLLADGRQIPIESVPPGEHLLAADGSTTVNSAEEIVLPASPHDRLYGINGIPPFFTGGHMLLTPNGWKAVDPEVPTRENPELEVGTLQVGDKVTRLVSVEPFRVDEVEIESIPSRMLTAESRVHGLRVEGPQSYFANGIAVSANYPELTEARIAEGIGSLSETEKALLLKILGPVMPLLLEAMRDFAGPRLYEALGVRVEESAP